VETFDTNVLVRLLVVDDPDQCNRAERAWRDAADHSGIYLPLVVLVELVWVLRIAYKFQRPTVVDSLRRLLGSQGVTVERESIVLAALRQYESGTADFSDYVILESARRGDALPVRTFDERFARSNLVELL
jgi:predicted nucleic-acid-binding protein